MDWSRTRFTMDEDYQKAVSEAFLQYHKKGWLYKAERVINWCIKDQTSLSDLELEYKEEKGKLWHIRYPIVSQTNADDAQTYAEDKLLYKDLTYKIRGILFAVKKSVGLGHKELVYQNIIEQ